jgi:phosphatidylglycerol---prolipoprotein diacylglyceryl transferase
VIPSYGAMAAAGLLLALALAQRTARTVGVIPAHLWNLCVIGLFAGLLGSRLLLMLANWRDVKKHPMWMLGLATVHHPLVLLAGAVFGALAALVFARRQRMPLLSTADALAAPVALGLAFEQFGALLAGAGFGIDTRVPWAVVYTSPLAARWSGTPLGVSVHPVQAYAALAFVTLSLLLLVIMPMRRQAGDLAGVALMGAGVAVFITEFWRDREGRGAILRGALDWPQVAALVFVIAGSVLLRERGAKPAPAIDVEAGRG